MITKVFVFDITTSSLLYVNPTSDESEQTALTKMIKGRHRFESLLNLERTEFNFGGEEHLTQRFNRILIGTGGAGLGHNKKFLFKILEMLNNQLLTFGVDHCQTDRFTQLVFNEVSAFNARAPNASLSPISQISIQSSSKSVGLGPRPPAVKHFIELASDRSQSYQEGLSAQEIEFAINRQAEIVAGTPVKEESKSVRFDRSQTVMQEPGLLPSPQQQSIRHYLPPSREDGSLKKPDFSSKRLQESRKYVEEFPAISLNGSSVGKNSQKHLMERSEMKILAPSDKSGLMSEVLAAQKIQSSAMAKEKSFPPDQKNKVAILSPVGSSQQLEEAKRLTIGAGELVLETERQVESEKPSQKLQIDTLPQELARHPSKKMEKFKKVILGTGKIVTGTERSIESDKNSSVESTNRFFEESESMPSEKQNRSKRLTFAAEEGVAGIEKSTKGAKPSQRVQIESVAKESAAKSPQGLEISKKATFGSTEIIMETERYIESVQPSQREQQNLFAHETAPQSLKRVNPSQSSVHPEPLNIAIDERQIVPSQRTEVPKSATIATGEILMGTEKQVQNPLVSQRANIDKIAYETEFRSLEGLPKIKSRKLLIVEENQNEVARSEDNLMVGNTSGPARIPDRDNLYIAFAFLMIITVLITLKADTLNDFLNHLK